MLRRPENLSTNSAYSSRFFLPPLKVPCGGCRYVLCHPRLVADNNWLFVNPLEKSMTNSLTWQELNKALHGGADECYNRPKHRGRHRLQHQPAVGFLNTNPLHHVPHDEFLAIVNFYFIPKRWAKKWMRGTSKHTSLLWQQVLEMQKTQRLAKCMQSSASQTWRSASTCRCDNCHLGAGHMINAN